MNKNTVLIAAAIVLVTLVVLFSSIFWLIPTLEIKDGSVVIPNFFTNPPAQNIAEDTNPEDLTFKGTFEWEEKDGIRPEDKSECYLRIYSTDDGTIAKFDYGEYLIDGWPVLLVSHTGGHYVFESSHNSLVERVRITVDVTNTGMSGTIENITPEISNFVRGSFTGETISFEEYADVILD